MPTKSLMVASILLFLGAGVGAYMVKSNILERVSDRLEREWNIRVADEPSIRWEPLPTGLHTLEAARISVTNLAPGGGGAMASIGGHILVVGRRGIFDYLATDGTVQRLDIQVPMDLDALLASEIVKLPQFRLQFFRVHGLLVLNSGPGQFDLLVSHHRFAGGCIEWVISRVNLRDTGDRLEAADQAWEQVFKAEPCIPLDKEKPFFIGHQGGGEMVALGANEILFGVGDHRFDGVYADDKASMNPDSHLGKILSLNLNTLEVDTFATGVRNPQALTQTHDGRLWEAEHGPRGGDEINLIVRGGNYGWPEVTYGMNYGGPDQPWPLNPSQGRHDSYVRPKFAFMPAIGPSDLIEVRGSEFPHWQGDLLLTSLVGESLFRLRIEGDDIVYAERIEFGERLRDMIQLDNGQVAILTRKGDIMFLRNKDSKHSGGSLAEIAETAPRHDAKRDNELDGAARGRSIFDSECGTCHTLTKEHDIGPHLVGLIGRKAGALKGFNYSPALKDADFRWDRKTLQTFFDKPWKVVGPLTMPRVILTQDEVNDLIEFLDPPRH